MAAATKMELPSDFIAEYIEQSGLEVSQIIVGMVMNISIVTQMPGYDFKLTVHILTQEENVVSSHDVIIAANGQTMADARMAYVGKYVFTVQDELGRSATPLRGRCQWQEKRNVFISPDGNLSLTCKGRGETVSEKLYTFNIQEKKKLLLPMPPLGWRIIIMTFMVKENGRQIKFVTDGQKEVPIIRPSTAQPRSALRAKIGVRRPKTARPRR